MNFASLVLAQTVLAALSALVIFLLAFRLSDSALIGWTAMLLVLASGELSHYARAYMTENISFLAIYAIMLFTVLTYLEERKVTALLAGLALGLAALARPSNLYLFYVMLPCLALAFVFGRKYTLRQCRDLLAAFVLGAGLLLLPWMMRNYLYFGDLALSAGYSSFTLVQRVAYNMMTWQEWMAAWVFWLPGIGENLAAALFPQHLYERLYFASDYAETFYTIGNGALRAGTLAEAGNAQNHLQLLLDKYVLGDLLNHMLISLPLSWRAIWPGGFLAPLGLILLWPVARFMRLSGRSVAFLLFILPPVFLVALHGSVSVSIERYNVPLIAIYAFVCSVALVNMLPRIPYVLRTDPLVQDK